MHPHFLQVKLSGVIFVGALTSETEDTPGSGVASPQHIFEASKSRGACSDGFLESAANGEMIEPPFYSSQGNDLFYTHELFWPEDGIPEFDLETSQDNFEASEFRQGCLDVSGGPAWESSFSYGEMLEPSSQISQGNSLFYMPADDSSLNASSYAKDSTKAPFETPNHRELLNFNGANHVIHDHQSPDKNGRNKAPFETPNYGDTSCFLGFNHVTHKQDSSGYMYPNNGDYPVEITEYNPVPATGTESKKPSNTFLNEYGKVQGHSKVKKNIDVNTSDSVPRASEVVDGAIYGGPPASENIKSSSSKGLPLVSCKKYGLHSEDGTKDGILESRRALPSLIMAGGTTIKNSLVAAHDQHSVLQVSEHPGVLPPPSIKAESKILMMESEVSEFNDSSLSNIDSLGVQNNTFERGNIEDDSDLCILEGMSAPARSNRVATNVKLVTAERNSISSHPGTQIVTTHAKRRPNNERVIFRVALQVNL